MPLRLHESTEVRFAPQVLKTLDALSDDDKQYYAKKFQQPTLLDVEAITEVRPSLRLVRVQFSGTRRAIARHVSNYLLIIAIGSNKKNLERFEKYGSKIGITECLPLTQTALAQFLPEDVPTRDAEEVKKELLDEILVQVQKTYATQESVESICKALEGHENDTVQLMGELEQLRTALEQGKRGTRSGIWNHVKALFFGSA